MDKIHKKTRGGVREKILRVLLNNPYEGLTKYRIAKLSKCTFSWTHEVLKQLEEQKMIESQSNKIKNTKKIIVSNFGNLLLFWKKCTVKPRKKEYMIRNPLDILKQSNLEYALTTYQAENLIQSYLFISRIDLYILPKDEQKWHDILREKGLVGKGNVRVLIKDEHIFYKSFKVNGLTVVSIPQLILDLLNEGGVCIEAAENMLKEKNIVIPKL